MKNMYSYLVAKILCEILLIRCSRLHVIYIYIYIYIYVYVYVYIYIYVYIIVQLIELTMFGGNCTSILDGAPVFVSWIHHVSPWEPSLHRNSDRRVKSGTRFHRRMASNDFIINTSGITCPTVPDHPTCLGPRFPMKVLKGHQSQGIWPQTFSQIAPRARRSRPTIRMPSH